MTSFNELKKGDPIFIQRFDGFKHKIKTVYVEKITETSLGILINDRYSAPGAFTWFTSYSNNETYFACKEMLIQKLESDLRIIGESAGGIIDTLSALKNNI